MIQAAAPAAATSVGQATGPAPAAGHGAASSSSGREGAGPVPHGDSGGRAGGDAMVIDQRPPAA
eukprot:6011566-Lingulodinium_polyedra.AAC.1